MNIFKEFASPKSVFEYQRQDKLFVTGRTVEKTDAAVQCRPISYLQL